MANINSPPLIDTHEVSIATYDPYQTTFKGKKIKLQSNPIFRNNYFLMCYNTSYNKVNGITLEKLPRNKLYYTFFPILQPKFFLLHLLLSFIPYFNILWGLFLLFMWAVYEKASRVYSRNKAKVPNPLIRMVFAPDLCKIYKSMNKFLEVPAQSLIFEDSQHSYPTTRVTIMIYNENFKKMQTHFHIYRYLHLLHLCICIILVLIAYFLLYKAFGLEII